MKFVLDAEAAALLPDLAGSARKQGEYVSRLIRQAAAIRAVGPIVAPPAALRAVLLTAAATMSALTKRLLAIGGAKQQGSAS